MGAIVVIVTAGNEEQANLLGEELVARRLASCVNIVPQIRSIYRWQGKICRDSEWMLVVKTMESEYPAIEATIQELHSYELPEILAFSIRRGEKRFLEWVAGNLDKDAVFPDETEEDEDLDQRPDRA
jgi:periplasmic divalent cation tolerance protein